ncbi:hypothetical protein QCA50_003871 [Cerrena zonata]|uniref:Uncharacterized protein n=1 Tax=Cerrena zonata TaxID=2478898 RepID=A0AAW0GHM3_9APHY
MANVLRCTRSGKQLGNILTAVASRSCHDTVRYLYSDLENKGCMSSGPKIASQEYLVGYASYIRDPARLQHSPCDRNALTFVRMPQELELNLT